MKEISIKNRPEIKVAKDFIEKFESVDIGLNTLLKKCENYINQVTSATKIYIEAEIIRILKGVDIEEINRGELSLRVSSLKKAGYTDFYKIYKTQSASTLAKVNGITLENAYKIKKLVYDDAEKLRQSIVPRLSLDNKTKEADNLVKSLYQYIESLSFVDSAKNLINTYEKDIDLHLSNCKILTNRISWVFASKSKKINAIKSYIDLQEIEKSGYFNEINHIIDNLTRIENVKFTEAWKTFSLNSSNYYSVLEKLEGLNLTNVFTKNGLSKSLVEEIESLQPDLTGLNCTLRSYQEFGMKYILNQGRVLLGDEMGLGKTVQAIASMVAIKNIGEYRFLVVCPASVLVNWCREINKFSDLRVSKLHGDDRDFAFQEWIQFGGVGITTFETLAKLDFSSVNNISLMVVDEAHYVKNPKANRTVNLMNVCLNCERILFMTGTALENRVEEMCFLISCLNTDVAKEIEGYKHLTNAPLFREKVSPVYLRRTREDVLKELPDLIISDEWCELTGEEKLDYYNSTMEENFMSMRQVSWRVDTKKSSKANRLLEIIENAKEDKRKVVVFSFFLNTIEKIKQMLGSICYGPINGSVSPEIRQKIIDDFSKGKDGSVLLAQIQAGGTGVNIQSASVIILCEPQLKPSTENQAISRTYRMGQTRNVLVYKLLCEDSVDERIVEILKTKENIFDNFADVSIIGKQSIEITEKLSKNIIKTEKERLNN